MGNGSVENLEIHADQIKRGPGRASGQYHKTAQCQNVTVSGCNVHSEPDAGGIPAVLCGSEREQPGTQIQESDGSVIVENCRAESCHEQCGTDGAVGGIAGKRQKKLIWLTTWVITQNGISDQFTEGAISVALPVL